MNSVGKSESVVEWFMALTLKVNILLKVSEVRILSLSFSSKLRILKHIFLGYVKKSARRLIGRPLDFGSNSEDSTSSERTLSNFMFLLRQS